MNRSIEEINKIVDIVMTDDDVWDAINNRILAESLERAKFTKAYKDGEKSGEEKGKAIGEQIGEANGERKSRIQIARKMLEQGISKENIAEITELTVEEIEKL